MTTDASILHERVRAFALERAERLGDEFIDTLRGNMPRRTGDMAASAEVDEIKETSEGVTVKVIVRSPYARFQNDGTGIYGPDGVPITPVRSPVLVFDWPAAGGLVFTRRVRGTEPTHFWERTLDQWPQMLRAVE